MSNEPLKHAVEHRRCYNNLEENSAVLYRHNSGCYCDGYYECGIGFRNYDRFRHTTTVGMPIGMIGLGSQLPSQLGQALGR